MVKIYLKDTEIAKFIQDKHNYLIEYQNIEIQNSIALSLPNTKKFYTYEYRFPPFFETFLPEGYLYEIFKNLLTKEYGYIDDYLIFSRLAPNIQSRITFKSDFSKLDFDFLNIENIVENDSADTFKKLLEIFLNKNAISGVQPKTVALLKEKETLRIKEYIIKTWGEEYPCLAENEYFCLKACEMAGIEIPHIKLSKNKKFLIVENFIFQGDQTLGFEEILSLQDKNRNRKYNGSYEQVAKSIYRFATHKKDSLRAYYKIVVMNYLLKNGDAHLKNFGLLFNDDFSRIWLSPAYDVVNTTSYIYQDKPALMMQGKKVWFGKEALVAFGMKHCLLTQKEADRFYSECENALKQTITEIESYMAKNRHFETIGRRMIESFMISLKNQTIKELPLELTRTW
ncbi:type II toxin-antitoxin system HipA family toxin [Sulfurovum sp.]|uniref:type II toxin-antitoxin system HipA family toxin n=1 Tax=Sulfurovum sp. TaxID=1969726 RepID=UPI0025E65AE9|nr:type II toxin-antitoxin system HipA family toxin [Sulfurovum sp.]